MNAKAYFLLLIASMQLSVYAGNDKTSIPAYFQDAILINQFRKLKNDFFKSDTTVLKFVYNRNTRKIEGPPKSIENFMNLQKEIIKNYGKQQGKADALSKGGAGSSSTTTPAPGGLSDERPAPNTQPAAAPAVKSKELNRSDSIEITGELLDLLFITDADDSLFTRYRQLPKRFNHLKEIVNVLAEVKEEGSKNQLQGEDGERNTGFAFNESAIIYGITDFVITRAKQELMEAHMKLLYEKLEGDTIIKQLIPNTLKIYKQFEQDNTLSLAKYGDLWKAAFQQDIKDLPVKFQSEELLDTILNRIYYLVETKKGENGEKGKTVVTLKNKETFDYYKKQIVPVIAGGDEIAYNIYLKKHPVNVFSALSERYQAQGKDLAIFKRAVIATDVSLSTIGEMQENVFMPVPVEVVKNMTPYEWEYFLKLVYLRNKGVLQQICGKDPIELITRQEAVDISSLKSHIIGAISTIKSFQEITSAKTISEKSDDKKLSFDDARKVFELSFQLSDDGLWFVQQYADSNVKKAINRYYTGITKPIIANVSQIGEGIAIKDYGKILDGTLQILQLIDTATCSNNTCESQLGQTIYYLTKYGSFMVNIISAKDAKQVQTALEEMIPKGQYKLKNAAAFSTSLSLYPGGYFGWERIPKYRTDENGNSIKKGFDIKPSTAFYLPIGIDLNIGIPLGVTKKGKSVNMSMNLFLQALDLGAVLNYRLTQSSDSTKSDPVLGYKQLFSPGATLIFHLPNSPVVIGGGFNYTPELRKIENAEPGTKASAFRYGFMFGIDVTAIHIALSKKKYKL